MFCQNCGGQLAAGAVFCASCGTPVGQAAHAQPTLAAAPGKAPKSKVTAGVLGILLGGLGIHKFYMGKIGAGVVYLLLCWTYIPAIIGLIEGILYLTQDDATFNRRVNDGKFF